MDKVWKKLHKSSSKRSWIVPRRFEFKRELEVLIQVAKERKVSDGKGGLIIHAIDIHSVILSVTSFSKSHL